MKIDTTYGFIAIHMGRFYIQMIHEWTTNKNIHWICIKTFNDEISFEVVLGLLGFMLVVMYKK